MGSNGVACGRYRRVGDVAVQTTGEGKLSMCKSFRTSAATGAPETGDILGEKEANVLRSVGE